MKKTDITKSRVEEAIKEGYKAKEIAELLDISISTVYRIIKELKTKKDNEENLEMKTMLIDGVVKQVREDKEVCYSTEKKSKEDEADLSPFQQQLMSAFKEKKLEVPPRKEEITVISTERGRKTQREFLEESNPSTSPYAKNEWQDIKFNRGDIVYIKLKGEDVDPGVQDYERMAIIIQNNTGNKYSGVVIVAMMTSVIKKMEMPTHVVVEPNNALPKRSMIMCEQIRTVSKGMISKRGTLSEDEINQLDKALATSLALDAYLKEVERLKAEVEKLKGVKTWEEEYNLLKAEYDRLKESQEKIKESECNLMSALGKTNRFTISLSGEDYSFSIKDGKIQITDNNSSESMLLESSKLESLIADLQEIKSIIK